MKRPFETWILIVLLVLLAINAFYGGISLILAPDGSLLGMQPGWLDNSPFNNYFIPGFLLLLMNGVFPLAALFGLITKNQNNTLNRLNIYKNRCWGWTFSLYSGIITNCWIIVQQLMAEYFILQTIIAAVGLLILIAALLPRVQRFYNIPA
ncbi:MAG TPA: hypothetical protein VLQ91_04815 [Draconibacterium sp.]|nr:hypothetical protein [Draconibacterium sp.]